MRQQQIIGLQSAWRSVVATDSSLCLGLAGSRPLHFFYRVHHSHLSLAVNFASGSSGFLFVSF
jgi:hypothetical protein